MKKCKKKILISFLLSLVLAVAGVFVYFFIYVNSQSKLPFYSFSENVYFETENSLLDVSTADILNFKGKYSDVKSEIYFNNLTENEKLIYKIYEYAFENCYTSYYIPADLLSGLSYNDVEILQFLSLDSPMVEQNFVLRTSKYTIEQDNSSLPKVTSFAKEYYHYETDMFSKENYNKKTEAYKKAEEIVSSVSDEFNDTQKAEYLYKEICKNIIYENYSKAETDICYLYDALITGKTHCDGFSNAISLVFNLADIQCYEKAFYDSPSEKKKIYTLGSERGKSDFEKYETPTGHTWCCFSVNGKWYDADGTVDCKDNMEKRKAKEYFGFGVPQGYFSDYKTWAFKDVLPYTEKSFLIENDLTFESVYDNNIVSDIYGILKSKKTIRIAFSEASMDDLKDLAKRVCDKYDISVYYGRCDSTPVTVYYSLRKQ